MLLRFTLIASFVISVATQSILHQEIKRLIKMLWRTVFCLH